MIMKILVILVFTVNLALIWSCFQLAFYKAYFRQKQTNAGRNPNSVLKQEWGKLWWLLL